MFQLSKPQQVIADDPRRFKVAICGRRFGKTFLSIRQIAYNARMPNSEVFYITSSYRAAKMIVWKPLKHRLQDLRWVSKINESELSILLKNGSTISLKGAENPDALRGVSLNYCVIDEAAQVDPTVWYEVVRPALADRQGGAMFISTPLGKSNWTYDLYTATEQQPNTWASFQYTTLQGGWVKPEEIAAARADMSERQFRQEFEATFETYENRVAWAWDRKENMVPQADLDTRELHIGIDFNVNPITAAIGVKHKDNFIFIDEIQMHNSNTTELADEIQRRYPKSRCIVYPDPAGAQRKTSANGLTDHKILESYGFRVLAPRTHDPVRDRVNAFNAKLCNAAGIRTLFVTQNNKYLIESLEKHTFKEGTQVPDKNSGFDHMFDAASYAIAYLYPIRRNTPETEPQRFGHAII